MNFTVNISSTVDENEWNDSLNKNSSSMIYQTTKWQELYETVYDSKPVYITVRDQLKNIVVYDDQLKVIMKDGEQNEHDKNNLINEFNNAMNEQVELEKFNDVINHNYNYKSKTVSVRKNKSYNNVNSNSSHYDDDDE